MEKKLNVNYVNWSNGSVYFQFGKKGFFYKRGQKPVKREINVNDETITISALTDKENKNNVIVVASNIKQADEGLYIVDFKKRKVR